MQIGRTARRIYLVVLGLPLAFVQNSSLNWPAVTRERPDLAIILLIELHPLPTALQAVSQAASLGLDDALIKPVQPASYCIRFKRVGAPVPASRERASHSRKSRNPTANWRRSTAFKRSAMVAHDVKNPLTAILGYSEAPAPA